MKEKGVMELRLYLRKERQFISHSIHPEVLLTKRKTDSIRLHCEILADEKRSPTGRGSFSYEPILLLITVVIFDTDF